MFFISFLVFGIVGCCVCIDGAVERVVKTYRYISSGEDSEDAEWIWTLQFLNLREQAVARGMLSSIFKYIQDESACLGLSIPNSCFTSNFCPARSLSIIRLRF